MPEVGVVAVSYFSVDALGPFLDSLVEASPGPLPVVVVSNGDDPGQLDVLAAREHVRVIRSEQNLGYGGAANLGVSHVGAEFVVIANPDVVWTPGALTELLAAAERWPRGAAFGPLIRTPEGEVYPSARNLPSLVNGIGHALCAWWWPGNRWTAAYRVERQAPVERTAGWLSGSCVLVRRAVFEQVGGFDTDYFMYFEDLDLGERLDRAGWQNVYVPSAVITHAGGHSTSRHAAAMAREHHHSAWRYLSRRYAGLRWAPLRWALWTGLNLRALVAGRVPRVAAGAGPQRHLPGDDGEAADSWTQ